MEETIPAERQQIIAVVMVICEITKQLIQSGALKADNVHASLKAMEEQIKQPSQTYAALVVSTINDTLVKALSDGK